MAPQAKRRRARSLTILTAVCALLVGCADVPDSGPVVKGLDSLQQTRGTVEFNPNRPQDGASQEEIVRGFVNAATSSENDYQIAREFLTPDYAAQWQPLEGVTVDASPRTYRKEADNISVLSVKSVATVDKAGVLATTGAGEPSDFRFELDRVDGEWRIRSAPAGIVIDRNTFQAAWRMHTLYFEQGNGELAVDPRWFPLRSALPTQVVSRLLAGPNPALASAAVNNFPEGTGLGSNGVTVSDNVVTVDLTAEGGNVSDNTQIAMVRQLARTLRSVVSAREVQLTVEGVEALSAPIATDDTSYGTPTRVLRDGTYGVLSAAGKLEKVDVSDMLSQLDSVDVSLSPSGAVAVSRTAQGLRYVTGDGAFSVGTGAPPTSASLDISGYVWWAAAGRAGAPLHVQIPGVAPLSFKVNGPQGAAVHSLSVSPTGSRVAVAYGVGESTEVRVYVVSRAGSGEPTEVNPNPETVHVVNGKPIDTDWIGNTVPVVLTNVDGKGEVTTVGISEFAERRGTVPEAVEVVGTSDRGGIRVLNKKGELFAPQGTIGWQKVANNITLLTSAG